MQAFDAKSPDEQYPFWVDFSKRLAPGETLASGEVEIRVSDDSDGTDTDPDLMLVGSATVNGEDFSYYTKTNRLGTVQASLGLFRTLGGGVDGCRYIVKFTAQREGGGTLIEEVLLPVQHNVP